jgi:hypothetical protein
MCLSICKKSSQAKINSIMIRSGCLNSMFVFVARICEMSIVVKVPCIDAFPNILSNQSWSDWEHTYGKNLRYTGGLSVGDITLALVYCNISCAGIFCAPCHLPTSRNTVWPNFTTVARTSRTGLWVATSRRHIDPHSIWFLKKRFWWSFFCSWLSKQVL